MTSRTMTLCASSLLLFVIVAAGADRAAAGDAPEPILLWPGGAPGAVGEEDADRPSIRIYAAPETAATGTAIVVCPGGGYGGLAMDHEGQQVARWLNSIGVTAAVLKYRLGPRYRHPAPLQDVQRAVRYMRAHSSDLQLAATRIGVMGFSAGGHLASTVSTHFDAGDPNAEDAIERASCRPDFSVLCYPVISFEAPYTHKGSVRNLLGEAPDPQLLHSLSNETQVTDQTPPAFIFHTAEDPGVPVQNALAYYAALIEHKIPAELHVYQNGPHGVGLAPGDPVLSTWKERLADWLRMGGFLADVERASLRVSVVVDGRPLALGAVILLPEDSNHPSMFGLVTGGRFAASGNGGPAAGAYRVAVWDLGSFEPRPTIEDARELYSPKRGLRIEVAPGENEVVLDLRR